MYSTLHASHWLPLHTAHNSPDYQALLYQLLLLLQALLCVVWHLLVLYVLLEMVLLEVQLLVWAPHRGWQLARH